jgi:hypothetical protein
LYHIWWTKCYFRILDNLCIRQKVVSWFSDGQEYQFLSCPLTHYLSSTKNSFRIKHSTTEIIRTVPLFQKQKWINKVQIANSKPKASWGKFEDRWEQQNITLQHRCSLSLSLSLSHRTTRNKTSIRREQKETMKKEHKLSSFLSVPIESNQSRDSHAQKNIVTLHYHVYAIMHISSFSSSYLLMFCFSISPSQLLGFHGKKEKIHSHHSRWSWSNHVRFVLHCC